tara:strand:- start:71 stop:934 length:864 start_codon:yes stop_codon:yes gene_type:complete
MKNKLSTFLLIIVAFIWGTAFVAQTSGMRTMGPFTFTAFRFLIGGISILPFTYFYFRKDKYFELKPILLIIFMGSALLIGGLFQQIALLYTSVANVAFLTALYVPIVPLIYFIYLKKPVSKIIIFAAISCIIGVWLLSENNLEFGSYGDLLSIIGAFFWSLHIILISKSSEMKLEPVVTAAFHIFFAGLICLILAFLIETPSYKGVGSGAFELIYTGIFSIGLGFTLQTIAQKHSPPTNVAIILSMESVFAALAAFIILGQLLYFRSLIGCSLILFGVIISEYYKEK